MKIGIIVHSQTGNTYSVAEKFKERLVAAGHSANIERIAPAGGDQERPVRLAKLPDLSGYDAFVFAAPVQAFSLSAVMGAYLKQLPDIKGKKAVCFVTKGLSFKWMGGKQAVSQIKKGVEAKGGTIVDSGMIHWGSKSREQDIAEMVDRLSKAFG